MWGACVQAPFLNSSHSDEENMAEKTYRIGEVAERLHLKSYVLRFWETEFSQLTPLRTDKGQRLYTEAHVTLLKHIKRLLHEQGMTIDGARRILQEEINRVQDDYKRVGASGMHEATVSGDDMDDFADEQEDVLSGALGNVPDNHDSIVQALQEQLIQEQNKKEQAVRDIIRQQLVREQAFVRELKKELLSIRQILVPSEE